MARENSASKTLYRPDQGQFLAGVCAGLGKYFSFDPVILRIIFILIAVFGGSGVLAYLLLWLVIPPESSLKKKGQDPVKESAQEIKDRAKEFSQELRAIGKKSAFHTWFGISLIFFGIIFLLNNFGIFSFFSLYKFWPLILIIIGLMIFTKQE